MALTSFAVTSPEAHSSATCTPFWTPKRRLAYLQNVHPKLFPFMYSQGEYCCVHASSCCLLKCITLSLLVSRDKAVLMDWAGCAQFVVDVLLTNVVLDWSWSVWSALIGAGLSVLGFVLDWGSVCFSCSLGDTCKCCVWVSWLCVLLTRLLLGCMLQEINITYQSDVSKCFPYIFFSDYLS